MEIMNYSEARAHLAATFDRVCRDHAPVVITRRGARPVVIMSLEDYEGVNETMYLISNPANAKRLKRSLEAAKKGKVKERDLIE